jgi:hypothetical protein
MPTDCMSKDGSENWASTSDPKIDYGGLSPCPGCGGPLEKDEASGDYVCYDCDHEWEAWELL